jgi:hypothetical protein
VSKAGFMMNNETPQLIIEYIKELDSKISGVKNIISDVKTEMSVIQEN